MLSSCNGKISKVGISYVANESLGDVRTNVLNDSIGNFLLSEFTADQLCILVHFAYRGWSGLSRSELLNPLRKTQNDFRLDIDEVLNRRIDFIDQKNKAGFVGYNVDDLKTDIYRKLAEVASSISNSSNNSRVLIYYPSTEGDVGSFFSVEKPALEKLLDDEELLFAEIVKDQFEISSGLQQQVIEEFAHGFASSFLQFVPVDVTLYDTECSSQDLDLLCWNRLKRSAWAYLQDRIHVIKPSRELENTATIEGVLTLDFNGIDRSYSDLAYIVATHCKLSARPGITAIEGGNIYYDESIKTLMIGRQELWRYTNPAFQNQISELNPNGNTQKDIENALVKAYNLPDDTVVSWIGTSKSRDTLLGTDKYSKDGFLMRHLYQPTYHIDLFFRPLGMVKKGDKLVYTYIVAKPMIEFFDSNSDTTYKPQVKVIKRFYSALGGFIDDSLKEFKEGLSRLDCETWPIEVPLGIRLRPFDDGLIHEYWSPANGFCENIDGDVTYYMPVYTGETLQFNYQKAKKYFRDKCGAFVKIVEVPAPYEHIAALHCRIKVLDRN